MNQDIKEYLKQLKDYWVAHEGTTELHIDTLVFLYHQTEGRDREKVFDMIYFLHQRLIGKLVQNVCGQYASHLNSDDEQDVYSLCLAEFARRLNFYEFPPKAPFPKYVKLYMRQWLNTYTKAIAKKNDKYVPMEVFLPSTDDDI